MKITYSILVSFLRDDGINFYSDLGAPGGTTAHWKIADPAATAAALDIPTNGSCH